VSQKQVLFSSENEMQQEKKKGRTPLFFPCSLPPIISQYAQRVSSHRRLFYSNKQGNFYCGNYVFFAFFCVIFVLFLKNVLI